MKNRKKLLFYLFLNIVVSAATTLLVLWLWDAPYRKQLPVDVPSSAGLYPLDNNILLAPAGTPIPPDEEVIRISNVFGAGDLQNEVIELVRVGQGEVWLSGWQLKDEDRHVYTFPTNLVMYEGGKIGIYTRTGVDSVIERYWALPQAVWQSGETATLLDAQGNVRAKYTIP